MQPKIYFIALLLCFANICFTQNTQSLVGTWKIISQKVTRGDSTSVSDLKTYEALKVVSPTHVSYLSVSKVDSSTLAFVARITADKDVYTEQFEHTSAKEMMGLKATFKYKIDNDKWSIKGGLTLNNVVYVFDEIWQKVN